MSNFIPKYNSKYLEENPLALQARIEMLEDEGWQVDPDGQLTHRRFYKKHYAIPDGWVVRHIDHKKKNNTLINLIALPPKLNQRLSYYETVIKRRLRRSEIEIILDFHLKGFSSKVFEDLEGLKKSGKTHKARMSRKNNKKKYSISKTQMRALIESHKAEIQSIKDISAS